MSALLPTTVALFVAGCSGSQSALDPAGRDAQTLADLFWGMLAAAIVLWLLLNGLAFFLTRIRPGEGSTRLAHLLIVGGGIAFPTVALAGLLTYGISIMPELREPGGGPDTVRIAVTGERWWWRVEYHSPGGGGPVVSANEVRLPVGVRTEIKLTSAKVIHSFWVPSLAGKMDMFPGRETRIALEPTKAGVYRGQCAEFCGESHALMAFATVAMDPQAFAEWLEKESSTAREPASDLARSGRALFLSVGCGACHSVRGTPAQGTFGPDLTHVGGRETLGAGIMPTDPAAFARWVAHTDEIKPGVNMPAFGHLNTSELEAIAAYLEGLT